MVPGPMQKPFDRRFARLHNPCDLPIGQPLIMLQHQSNLLAVRQSLNLDLQEAFAFLIFHSLMGMLIRLILLTLANEKFTQIGNTLAAFLLSQNIYRFVNGDPIDPGSEIRLLPKSTDGLMHLQKDVLSRILGIGPIFHKAVAGIDNALRILFHERPERFL